VRADKDIWLFRLFLDILKPRHILQGNFKSSQNLLKQHYCKKEALRLYIYNSSNLVLKISCITEYRLRACEQGAGKVNGPKREKLLD
jgi:hypothetical protein